MPRAISRSLALQGSGHRETGAHALHGAAKDSEARKDRRNRSRSNRNAGWVCRSDSLKEPTVRIPSEAV